MDNKATRIYILDDEAIFAFSIEHYLKKDGYSNIFKFEKSSALYAMMTTPPDVLILDHYLHNELGLDVLEKIKESHPDVKVIYLSAQKTATIAIKALKFGAFAYLEKNMTDIKEIVEIIKSEETTGAAHLQK